MALLARQSSARFCGLPSLSFSRSFFPASSSGRVVVVVEPGAFVVVVVVLAASHEQVDGHGSPSQEKAPPGEFGSHSSSRSTTPLPHARVVLVLEVVGTTTVVLEVLVEVLEV